MNDETVLLPPATRAALAGVSRRRHLLLTVRAVALVMTMCLTAWLVAALVDHGMLLGERVRWWMAAAVCAVAVVAGMAASLPWARRWSRSDAARLVERELPHFRDRLLAAVELSADSGHASPGSRSFRERLQQQVADEAASIVAAEVLPWRWIAGWLLATAAVVGVTAGLVAIPSLHLRQHLLRVLIPSANVPRPSLATLSFRSPTPPEATVALGEQLAVTLDLHLAEAGLWNTTLPATIQLEVQPVGDAVPASEGRQVVLTLPRQTQRAVDEHHSPADAAYAAQWLIETPHLRYRAVSPIGETPWYVLHGVPRPEVAGYRITVTPPDYATMPPSTVEAESADVTAVIGSRIHWDIRPSRPLADARLKWVGSLAAGEEDDVPLVADGDGSWWVTLPVDESRRFHLTLTGPEGLTSAFPSTARLTALEDRPPRLAWVQPATHEQTVLATSTHALSVELADEFPVMTLEHHVRVNRGVWRAEPLGFDALRAEQKIELEWSLASLPLLPGDFVESKVVAVDRRGLQGESPVLEWVISESLLTLSPAPQDPTRRELAADLGRLAGEAEALLADVMLAAVDPPTEEVLPERTAEQATLRQRTQVASIRSAVTSLAASAGDLRARITSAAATDDPLAGEELALAAAALARLEAEERRLVERAADATETALEERRTDVSRRVQHLIEAAKAFRERLVQADRHVRTLVTQDVLDDAAQRLDAAVRFQEEQTRRPELLGSEAWAREQQLLAAHMRALASMLARDAALMPGGAARQVLDRRRWADEVAERLERAADGRRSDRDEAVARAVADAAEMLADLRQHRSVHSLHPGLPAEAIRARQELRRMAGTSADVIARASDHDMAAATASATAATMIDHTLTQLLMRREVDLARGGRDHAQAAADLGTAHRGLHAVLGDPRRPPEPLQKVFSSVAAAVRILEAGGRLQTAIGWTERMRAYEHDASRATLRQTVVPRLWEAIGEELEDASAAMRQAGLPDELANRVRAARWSAAAETVGRKVGPRRWDGDQRVTAAAELEDVQAELEHALAAMAEAMAAARAVLERLAPSISDLARSAAEEAGRRQEAAERLASEAADGSETASDAVLPAEIAGADSLSETTGQLEAALVDEAARQDLLDGSQRARAKAADLARELTRAVSRRVDEATAAVRDGGPLPPHGLTSLANAYREAEKSFAAIADHFGSESAASRAAAPADRRTALAEMADAHAPHEAARLEESYATAEQLGQLADSDPQELLHRLEQELRSNEPMQEALSDIAAGLATEAQATLAFAAKRERTLRSDIEQSDGNVRDEKRWFAAELTHLAEQAARVARRLGEEAQRQAAAGGHAEEQQQLGEAAGAIAVVADEVRQVPADAPLPALIDAAFRLETVVEAMPPRLTEIAGSLRAASAVPRHASEDDRRRSVGEVAVAAGRWHQQDVRWADQNLQARERRIQEADRLVQEADRQLLQADARLAEARERYADEPGSASLGQQLQQMERQQAESRRGLERAREIRDREEERLTQARRAREEAGAGPTQVDAPAPHTQLAGSLTEQAARQAKEIASQLGEMLAAATWRDQLAGSRQQLEVAARQQQGVTASVADAARALDRAADHERRLEAHARAGQLADAARRVDTTARQEPAAAEQVLSDAAASAAADGNGDRASPAVSREAVEAVSRAGEAINQRADEIARLLSTATEAGDDRADSPSPADGPGLQASGSNPAQGLLEPVEMARLLDQLDRQLREPEGGQAGQPGQQLSAAAPLARRSQELARSLQQQRRGSGSPQASQEMIDPAAPPGRPTGTMASAAGTGQPRQSATGEAAGEVRLLDADGRDMLIGGWSQLRSQQAVDVVESLRARVSPRYRRQVETYFRELSQQGLDKEPQP